VIVVVAAIIRANEKILITRRPKHVHLPDLWEFPGGKVEPDESLEDALHREIREELGIEISIEDEYFFVEHQYPEKAVALHFFKCRIHKGEPRPLHAAEVRWVDAHDLVRYPFPEADAELIARLLKR
jgi:mutator protein MutT